ncbi:MAG: hypothetical protein KBT82_09785 [Marinobacter sp.]|nr:hypothetical protein [Marinobacter sp.]MBQ0745954.1 hypothetical protein [Marinobacter sp.]MBQ0814447.1 hypothetical protein [Marinobacter sp.]|tara:strand:+ start:1525 stop:1674 length:150 start_codon:yes stop_codon:yes gene_type:complete
MNQKRPDSLLSRSPARKVLVKMAGQQADRQLNKSKHQKIGTGQQSKLAC